MHARTLNSLVVLLSYVSVYIASPSSPQISLGSYEIARWES
jgi:hypothetical protein